MTFEELEENILEVKDTVGKVASLLEDGTVIVAADFESDFDMFVDTNDTTEFCGTLFWENDKSFEAIDMCEVLFIDDDVINDVTDSEDVSFSLSSTLGEFGDTEK